MIGEGRSAVFVDLSSLNVVFKLNDKFMCALNYGSGLEHLASVMPALGTGYDIYLCLMPRAEGEGDMVVSELGLGGLPFTVNSEELYQVLKYFRESSGVGEVYLCNWLANYIACARVPSFESVFFYGDRVAYISVKSKMLETFKLYDNQLAFTDGFEGDYTGYGDVDLIDANGLSAQYPELHSVSKVQMTCLAPLIQSYRSPMRVATDELYEKLKAKYQRGEDVNLTPRPGVKPEPEPVEDVNIQPATEEIPEPPELPKERKRPSLKLGRTPLVAKALIGVSCAMAFTIGVFTNVVLNTDTNQVREQYFIDADNRIAALQSMATVYTGAMDNSQKAVDMFAYVNNSGLAVTIMGFDFNVNGSEVRCACASQELATSYQEYIGESYTVVSTNDLGQSQGADGTVYQFSISFM